MVSRPGRTARATALALAAVLAAVAAAAAQEVAASIEPQLVPVGGIAELTIEVDLAGVTGRVDEPALPELPPQVAVVGRSKESRVQMSGLDVRRQAVFRYSLRGLEPGTVRIEPIAVRVGGETRRTEPLVLLVVGEAEPSELGRAAGGAPPIFVSARVDRERAWTGQQVTLTFSFYHDPATALAESPDYDPPQTPGFWRVELSDAPEISSERVGGRTYQVQRFRYALFPLQAGAAEIGPARVRVVQPDPERWWEPGRPRILQTDPLTVMVDELPDGAPPGFGGAVGRYTMSGRLPVSEATAGSPIELALTVRGSGNPSAVGAPELPQWPDIEVGPPNVETESEVDGARLGGRATFRWILVPRGEGSMDLGAARLPYFDPEAGTYAVDTLQLGELRVRPGPVVSASTAAGARALRPTLWEPREPRAPRLHGLGTSPLYWAALAAPGLAWLGLAAWSRRPRRARAGPKRRAAEIVAAARAELELRRGEAAPQAARAVEQALEIHCGASLAGLSPRERRALLERHGAGAEVVAAAEVARAALEGIRFGGVGVERAARELERLDAALRAEAAPATEAGPATGATPRFWTLVLVLSLAWPAFATGGQEASRIADSPPLPTGSGSSAASAWGAANDAYRGGDLAGAIRAYEALTASHDDPRLEANLAAALWRAGRRGEALARYRSALALAPRNGVMRAEEQRLWIELGQPARSGPLARALAFARLDELLAALLVVSWLAFLAAWAGKAGRHWARPIARALAGLALALAAASALHAWSIERPERGVAIAGAELRAAPGGESIAALPEGATVQVLERTPEAWRVRTADLPAGWVAPDRIVPLN